MAADLNTCTISNDPWSNIFVVAVWEHAKECSRRHSIETRVIYLYGTFDISEPQTDDICDDPVR